jgi:cholinesterase
MVLSRSFLLVAGAAANFATSAQTFIVGQTVGTTSGNVIGQAANRRSDVSEYLGIPYAQPPVGSLRWAAPRAYVGNDTISAVSRVSG